MVFVTPNVKGVICKLIYKINKNFDLFVWEEEWEYGKDSLCEFTFLSKFLRIFLTVFISILKKIFFFCVGLMGIYPPILLFFFFGLILFLTK